MLYEQASIPILAFFGDKDPQIDPIQGEHRLPAGTGKSWQPILESGPGARCQPWDDPGGNRLLSPADASRSGWDLHHRPGVPGYAGAVVKGNARMKNVKVISYFLISLLLLPACARQPQPARVEEITFESGSFNIVGDLRLPEGTAPFPVVLFVHGSGGADRTNFGGTCQSWSVC